MAAMLAPERQGSLVCITDDGRDEDGDEDAADDVADDEDTDDDGDDSEDEADDGRRGGCDENTAGTCGNVSQVGAQGHLSRSRLHVRLLCTLVRCAHRLWFHSLQLVLTASSRV